MVTRNIGVEIMIKIGHKEISRNAKPFIIAEMSGNHNQSLERALYLVDLAAEAGVVSDIFKIPFSECNGNGSTSATSKQCSKSG